ncbi:hypothetical protein [Candidatus Methanodesulfokora washburnensis]|uniref:Uncharacterized protein n=1 Tax=Candidatus Methanodesulfokora washburnensis TaxID=2478471 RepID=A0A429GPK9_9CREN|nr:hypothetical protein [Candidatus Methanodesulfokores washburnensis]RSN75788.1 hypothetical protein D6D85_05515 [Candidatus Methanodesulfokores washburnensis]
MSRMVRSLLRMMGLYELTDHEDRLEIDREIERRTGVSCDEAIEMGLIGRDEFLSIVQEILRRKKGRKEVELYI